MKKISVIIVLSLCTVLIATACGRKKEEAVDLTSTHTTAAKETMTPLTTEAATDKSAADKTAASTDAASSVQESSAAAGTKVSTSIHTYTAGMVSIEYPVISGLNSDSVQETANKKLLENATSIVKAYAMDTSKDELAITCRVVNADRRRMTAVYTGLYTPDGAPYSTNIFYTNTINTSDGSDLSLSDYADAYTLAGYVLSDDCRFYEADSDLRTALMEDKNQNSLEYYTSLFKYSDFPYRENEKAGKDAAPFPESFSYEEAGTIYVSIPVLHALGDYALIQYSPESK